MEWLALGKLILGPILGVFGAWLTHRQEEAAEVRKAKERAEERAHDLAVMGMEADIATKRAVIASDTAQAVADTQAFSASYQFANDSLLPEGFKPRGWQAGWLVFIEGLNKLIRPAGVIWYQIVLAVVFGWSGYIFITTVESGIANAQMATLFREVCYSIIGMAETSFFWFFGVRRMSKKG